MSGTSFDDGPLKRAWKNRKAWAGAALYWSGVAGLFQSVARPTGAIIIMYHSVARADIAAFIDPPNHLTPSRFDQQMAFLRKHRNVVSLSDLTAQLESGETPAAGTVCITFDDGYLDNLTVAAPILARHGLPATLYAPTGYIERAEPQWADVLHWAFHHRTRGALRLDNLGVNANLCERSQCGTVRTALHLRLLEAPHAERRALLAEIEQQLQPAGTMPRLTMNWDELRELERRYPLFDIGGHSRDHIDLRTHGIDTARAEIIGCADDLRRELGRRVQHFSFPYGRWNEAARALVPTAGWRSAVGSNLGYRIGPGSHRYAMPRIETPESMTALRFMTSGAFPGVYALLGKH